MIQSPRSSRTVRCAIYTRKSTEEGLEQEFNSLQAQRESAEAYIASQVHEGWHCLGERYDDGGFTGGNMDRPALRRLLAAIEAGMVDCVVVYKVDRLSRSLLDFARMMEVFERQRVSFVSVTQQFNTTNSMGRLMLNVLLSFAQFEREIISERTRDKMGAARRKGLWLGGTPVLGYNLDGTKLVVNQVEAKRVRKIFLLYLKHRGLIAVVRELERRGWSNKHLMTREGNPRGGKLFTKTSLYRLLTNVTYIGKTLYKGTLYDGQHDSIVEPNIWERVQAALALNGKTGGKVRHPSRALLKHILHCRSCGCAMSPSHVVKGNKRYRYYVCSSAQKRGWETCPSKTIAAHEIERIVVNQIQGMVTDPVWEALALSEQTGRIKELVERIDYDGRVGKVWIVFRSSVQSLAAASPLAHSETTT
jgi:site-specific DNA recombinase